MLYCQCCYQKHASASLTKCCRNFICTQCRDKYDKKPSCFCGKPTVNKKLCLDQSDLYQIISQHHLQKPTECDRCEQLSTIECMDCQLLLCKECNIEIHAAVGYIKHDRRVYKQKNHFKIQQLEMRELRCLKHSQAVIAGCQCGSGLCSQCLKVHRDNCPRNSIKTKLLKQFKDQYFLNFLSKMRQITVVSDKLQNDKKRYAENYANQKQSLQSTLALVEEQFQYLSKILEIKKLQINLKIDQYWKNCEDVYHKNTQIVEETLKSFSDYSRIIEKCSRHGVSLDYFDRRIRRISLQQEYFNLKGVNFDQAQAAISSIDTSYKTWSTLQSQGPNQSQLKSCRQDIKTLGNYQNITDLLFQYAENPLKDRKLVINASHCELSYNFIHLPYQNLEYQVEYGVGMRIKGEQIFKKIRNNSGFGVIEGLNPSTKYRVRMRDNGVRYNKISTLSIPYFSIENNSYVNRTSESSFKFIRAGTVFGSNEINFGVHRWVVRVIQNSITYEETQTACISVGVSNKQTKRVTFVGATYNYGFQKEQITIRVLLDCSQRKLVIQNCSNNQKQVYQNLPNFPVYPSLQNKGNSQVIIKYNMNDDISSL